LQLPADSGTKDRRNKLVYVLYTMCIEALLCPDEVLSTVYDTTRKHQFVHFSFTTLDLNLPEYEPKAADLRRSEILAPTECIRTGSGRIVVHRILVANTNKCKAHSNFHKSSQLIIQQLNKSDPTNFLALRRTCGSLKRQSEAIFSVT
jgi:hypothetical protein